ncbi:MAG TPA: hypothetical protein ENN13_00145 [Candidatus Altiarchaeales archaeon]|nr:hypothetical protein [Candidatus Altiarchaeales archaeon]
MQKRVQREIPAEMRPQFAEMDSIKPMSADAYSKGPKKIELLTDYGRRTGARTILELIPTVSDEGIARSVLVNALAELIRENAPGTQEIVDEQIQNLRMGDSGFDTAFTTLSFALDEDGPGADLTRKKLAAAGKNDPDGDVRYGSRFILSMRERYAQNPIENFQESMSSSDENTRVDAISRLGLEATELLSHDREEAVKLVKATTKTLLESLGGGTIIESAAASATLQAFASKMPDETIDAVIASEGGGYQEIIEPAVRCLTEILPRVIDDMPKRLVEKLRDTKYESPVIMNSIPAFGIKTVPSLIKAAEENPKLETQVFAITASMPAEAVDEVTRLCKSNRVNTQELGIKILWGFTIARRDRPEIMEKLGSRQTQEFIEDMEKSRDEKVRRIAEAVRERTKKRSS